MPSPLRSTSANLVRVQSETSDLPLPSDTEQRQTYEELQPSPFTLVVPASHGTILGGRQPAVQKQQKILQTIS